MPVDIVSLAALSELTARPPARSREDSCTEPEAAALHPTRPRALRRPSTPAERRWGSLAAGSITAGLVCGLLVPTASAQPSPSPAPNRPAASSDASVLQPASPIRWAAAPVPARAAARPGIPTEAAPPTRITAPTGTATSPVRTAKAAAAAATATAPAGTAQPVAGAARPSGWPLPAASGTGRRIVYSERRAHLWVVGADGTVLRDYPVTGRVGRPGPGTYRVYSTSPTSVNPIARVRFDLMVRFARGITGAPIGFHTIPRWYDGRPLQSDEQLGTAIGQGGCVRQSRDDAEWLYAWARVGDAVVVVR